MNHTWSLAPTQLPLTTKKLHEWWSSQSFSNLLILIDDGNAMIPFRPAISPITELAENETTKPVHIYRFTVYPDEYLYLWKKPTTAVLAESILAEIVQQDTLTLIISDGAAIINEYSEEVEAGLSNFLEGVSARTQNILWLNPLPEIRWKGTTAQAMAQKLKMLSFDVASQTLIPTPN